MNETTRPAEATSETVPVAWTLTLEEFAATRERAEKINARAAKRGFTGRIEVTGTRREISEHDEAGLTRTRVVMETEITGEAPQYGGWRFLAAVDSVETADGAEFILRTAPGIDESGVDRVTLEAGRCEHCKTKRTNRRYTYLVQHEESGELVQVGSTCVKDFTGWTGKPVFISHDELADELREHVGGGGPAEYTPETVVAVAWAVSRRHGWVPASKGGVTTRDLVGSYLYGAGQADKDLRAEVAPEIPAAAEKAREIIPALLDHLDGGSDYIANLKTALRALTVDARHMGITVSAVSAYERMTGEQARKKLEAEQRAQQRASVQFAGEVGEKLTVTGTVTRLRAVEGSYGYQPKTSLLIILEGGGVVAKMFTTAAWAWEIEQGDGITVTGVVKDHEDYQGIKQTVLTRPKRVDSTQNRTEEAR